MSRSNGHYIHANLEKKIGVLLLLGLIEKTFFKSFEMQAKKDTTSSNIFQNVIRYTM